MSERFILKIIAVLIFILENSSFAQHNGWFSPAPYEWEFHKNLPWDPFPPVPFTAAEPLPISGKPSVSVLGYLPYWTYGSVTLQFDKLHVLAYFGAALSSDGSIGETHHWGTKSMDDLIATAHKFNVKVILTATNFSKSSIHSLLSSDSWSKNAIQNLVKIVYENGGDGINVDFEGLDVADKSLFVAFVSGLKNEMEKAVAGSHVSVATPAVDFSGAFDYDKLAGACDGLMIMGYGYHWQGGPPGPVSPLDSSSKWGKYSLAWTIGDYLTYAGEQNKDKIILGLPLYGFDWPAADDSIPGKATDDAKAVFYAKCQTEGKTYGWKWDVESQTPYFLYQNPDWHQVFCENVVSMSQKYQLIAANKLGGIGFWALGYEENYTEVWEELSKIFPETPVETESDTETSDVSEASIIMEDTIIEDILVPDDIFISESVEETINNETAQDMTAQDEDIKIMAEFLEDSPEKETKCSCPGCMVSFDEHASIKYISVLLLCFLMMIKPALFMSVKN
jgi:spore germination protein YaaH